MDGIPRELVDGLVRDAETAGMLGIMAAFRHRYQRESRSYVLMCGCADWLMCVHPWPMISHPMPFPTNAQLVAEAQRAADAAAAQQQGGE